MFCRRATNKKFKVLLWRVGPRLLQSFIDEGIWDEARVITNQSLVIDEELARP